MAESRDDIAQRALRWINAQPAPIERASPAKVVASYPLGRAWYVAETEPRAEFAVCAAVIGLGFDACAPRERRRRKGKITEAAIFSGYCLVSFDPEREDWGAILDTDGVVDIINIAGAPARMREGQALIDTLRRAEEAGVFDHTRPALTFTPGDELEIMEGPLAGIIAKFRNANGKKRAKLLHQLLGTIDVDAAILRKV